MHGGPTGVQARPPRPPHLPHLQNTTRRDVDVEMSGPEQHDKDFNALDISARIPRGARLEGKRRGGAGGFQVWTFLLLCLVLTLVLINDMVTYGHLDDAGSVSVCVRVLVW